jgi:glycine cleavage system H protein
MHHPDDCRYHPEHTWAKAHGDRIRIGITDHAQDQLSTVVYVDLPPVGDDVGAGRPFGGIESTKTLNDLVAPVSGRITAVNGAVVEDPELVNRDAYGEGWLIEVVPAVAGQLDALLSAADDVAQVGA